MRFVSLDAALRRVLLFGLPAAVLVLPVLLLETDARACGGCFHPPPGENPSVVTDHRMILSISKQQSTLWDQIKYTGSPSSFAWVLPVSGTVEVGISADSVFGNLDALTATSILEPPKNCPRQPQSSSGGCSSVTDAQSSLAGGADRNSGVEVTKRDVVGPYETVQLKATDAGALEKWLSQNGFVVTPDVQPIVNQYVTEKFDFLALKLLPGKGVQDMRPVRVTTHGANAVLPLRMVSAGTGSMVGITLWVLGEGRYEPQNFPTFRIKDDELVWDWAQNRSNYMELRAQKTQAASARAWDLESSQSPNPQQFRSLFGSSSPSPIDYQADDKAGKSAEQVRSEDLTALFEGKTIETTRVTRLRADLAHAALSEDLVMLASADQGVLPNVRQATKESGQPMCFVYTEGRTSGMAPRDEAAQRMEGDERFGCTTSSRSRGGAWLGAAAAALALAIARARCRRAGKQC